MRLIVFIVLIGCSAIIVGQDTISENKKNDFVFLKPFKTQFYGSLDLGVELNYEFNKPDLFKVGVYMSQQTSALGAGIYFFQSYSGNFIIPHKDVSYGAELSSYWGVTLIGIGLKVKMLKSDYLYNLSVAPQIGFGVHRLLYCTFGYQIDFNAPIVDRTKTLIEVVGRIPLFTKSYKYFEMPQWD